MKRLDCGGDWTVVTTRYIFVKKLVFIHAEFLKVHIIIDESTKISFDLLFRQRTDSSSNEQASAENISE